jgi:hypothetical protein
MTDAEILALAVRRDEDERDVIWLPRSLVEIEPADPRRGDVVTVTLSERYATEKGLC